MAKKNEPQKDSVDLEGHKNYGDLNMVFLGTIKAEQKQQVLGKLAREYSADTAAIYAELVAEDAAHILDYFTDEWRETVAALMDLMRVKAAHRRDVEALTGIDADSYLMN